MAKQDITQYRLKELLDYDPDTGLFRWKVTKGSRAAKGHLTGNGARVVGYCRIRVDGEQYLAHRLAWLYVYGEFPGEIDHIDHQRDNNAISNLREVTRQENSRNRGLNSRNRSRVIGVSWHTKNNKWRSAIKLSGKDLHLGCFDSIFDAAAARKSAEIKYGFHSNHGMRTTA